MKKVFALVLTTVLLLSLTACGRRFPALTPGSDKPASTSGRTETSVPSTWATAGTTQSTTEPTTEVTEPSAETTESTTEPATEAVSTGVTPEFKATMDAYEAFFDEYVDFMQKFTSSENTLGMMTQYASMMARYAETMSALDEIDSDSLSEADALYYMEVALRITKKLADIA